VSSSPARYLTLKPSLRACFLLTLYYLYNRAPETARVQEQPPPYQSILPLRILDPALPLHLYLSTSTSTSTSTSIASGSHAPLLRHLNSLSTLHHQTRAIHEPRHIRAQKYHRIGHIVRQADPLDRRAPGPGVLLFGSGELVGVDVGEDGA
jgi:hypothetical protein